MTQHDNENQRDRVRYGTVHERADGYRLRFERHLLHSVEKVWTALTSPAQLAQWFAPGEIELTLGGRVSLAFTDGDTVVDGRVTEFAPPRLLEFSWTDKGNDLGYVRWELLAEDGGTQLVLTHTVPEVSRGFGLPALAGWHSLLERLTALLDGQPVSAVPDRWQAFHDDYARAGVMGAPPNTEGETP
ncbi:MAG: SRPBCC family protein [Propionibacteriaceae bacterium]|nr:SRPBCC family protein [Propionibacteriaceae bacterium]